MVGAKAPTWILVVLAITILAGCSGSDPATPNVDATGLGSESATGGLESNSDRPGGSDGESTESEPVQHPAVTVVAHATVDEIIAYRQPQSDQPDPADEIGRFSHPTDRGGPAVFTVIESGQSNPDWLEVMLPVRPNGTTGWISRSDVGLSANPYRIEIDMASFTLRVFHSNELKLETTVALGEGETPTPVGEFYLIELLKPSDPTGVYGPYAYGLSGFSDTLEEFNGGEGVIGIHGTNQPEALGTRVSHGCIRVANEVITEMATFLPLGTPISIS